MKYPLYKYKSIFKIIQSLLYQTCLLAKRIGSLSLFTVSARLPSVPSVMNETVEDIFSDLDNYLADIQWVCILMLRFALTAFVFNTQTSE